jgi:hypothetical protein
MGSGDISNFRFKALEAKLAAAFKRIEDLEEFVGFNRMTYEDPNTGETIVATSLDAKRGILSRAKEYADMPMSIQY